MAIFGYVIWIILCLWVSVGTIGMWFISKAFDTTGGSGKVAILFLLVNILMWYGAYTWFPFTVTVK